MRPFRGGALAALLVTGCAPLPPGAALGADGAGAADARVVVGSFAAVDAVAVSRRFVYVAARGGLAVFDRFAERWGAAGARDLDRELGREWSVATPGMALGAPITIMAGDPVEDAVWIGVPEAVILYRPFTGQVQRTMVSGVPQRIVFDRAAATGGEALVLSAGQWTRISRIGVGTALGAAPSAADVLVPPTLSDLLTRYPTLRAQPQLLVRGEAPNRPRRAIALTAGAASPDGAHMLWLGTNGQGLVRFDPVLAQGAALPFGLLDPGAGALAPAANGVWVAGLGVSSERGGLTFATSDLQQWRWIEGTLTTPLAGARGYALATRGNVAWLATDRGLVRAQLDGTQDMTAFGRLAGLPDDRVFAVAARDDGAWAGTARGLVFVHEAPSARELRPRAERRPGDPLREEALRDDRPRTGPGGVRLEGLAVFALQLAGPTLWVGTAAGLVRLPADPAADGGAPVMVGTDPGLRRPVRALAASDSVLLVGTDDAVYQRLARPDTATPMVRLSMLEPRLVGEVTRLAADERTVALAGRDGILLLSRASGALRPLRVPEELPGPALDLLLQRDWLFVATPQGLVRFRRTADGLVP